MALLFKPFSIIAGLIAGFIGKKVFEQIWALFDDQEPPESEDRHAEWGKIIAAAALEGAIFRATKEAVDHSARMAFANVTGSWPGDEHPDKE
jgi:hypothetical protein